MVASAFHFDFVKGGTKLPLTPGATCNTGLRTGQFDTGLRTRLGQLMFRCREADLFCAPERPATPPDCGIVDSFAAKHN